MAGNEERTGGKRNSYMLLVEKPWKKTMVELVG
jgi:hypothetical protein